MSDPLLEDLILNEMPDVGLLRIKANEQYYLENDKRDKDLEEKAGNDLAAYEFSFFVNNILSSLVVNCSDEKLSIRALKQIHRLTTIDLYRRSLGDALSNAINYIYSHSNNSFLIEKIILNNVIEILFYDYIESSCHMSALHMIKNITVDQWKKQSFKTIQFVLKQISLKIQREEDRQLSNIDFDYAFNEFKLINVKLLDDDTKKPNRPTLHWSDIGGMDDLKQELIQTVQWRFQIYEPTFSSIQIIFSNVPIRLISGILLYGPSGCGKTLLAQTLANECKVNFLQVKGPELLNKYVGSSEQNIRDLLNRARSVTPCIILFDEFEALVPRHGRDSAGVTDRVVSQLLTELDGVESLEDIVVIAATSRPDLIDSALLRPGRLDKHLYIGFPTKSDIISILKIWTKKIHLSDDIKFDDETIISHCEMYTGADIKALIYNAQLAAFDENQSKQSIIIHKHHFISAIKQTPYSIPVHMRNANEHLYV
ncbi:unnamed protein product [Rotaria sp. Silwood2]|nr:unnamed protein product [Rotaria sp. Silwood2]